MNTNPSRFIFVGLIVLGIFAYLFALAAFNQSQKAAREQGIALTQVARQETTLVKTQTTSTAVSPAQSKSQPTTAPIPIPTVDQSASIAFSREIATQAVNKLQIDPELSLLLATEAMRVANTDQAEYALRRSLVESNVRMILREHNGPVYKAIYSPDGKYIATGGKDGNARLWNTSTGQLLATLDAQVSEFSLGMINTFVFSPDGNLLVTVGGAGIVKMWHVPDGKLVRVLSGEESLVSIAGIAFSPDHKWLMGVECRAAGALLAKRQFVFGVLKHGRASPALTDR